MALHYKIRSVANDAQTGGVIATVDYWLSESDFLAGLPPWKVNDHIFGFERGLTDRRIVTDAQGRLKRSDGVFIRENQIVGDETWEYEIVPRDLGLVMRRRIESYADRLAAGTTGASPCTRTRTETDTRGVRTQEVRDLEGRDFQVREGGSR